MSEKLKNWAWSRPEYNEAYWDKVDEVVDNVLATAFENDIGKTLIKKLDEGIVFLENTATKTVAKIKEIGVLIDER